MKDAVTAVSRLLKERFPNLTVQETIDMAFKIVEVVQAELERGKKP